MNKKAFNGYAKALSSLRSSLYDKTFSMESETLCASILLQLFEVSLYCDDREGLSDGFHGVKLVMNGDRGRWSHLVRGTAWLLEARGVKRVDNAFDQAMLESQIAYIVSALDPIVHDSSLLTGGVCL